MSLEQIKERRTAPITILAGQDSDIFGSLSQQSHNGGDSATVSNRVRYPGANVLSMPKASHWLTAALLRGPSATTICSQRLLLRKPWGLQLEPYLHTTLCNSPDIEEQPNFFVSSFPSYLRALQ